MCPGGHYFFQDTNIPNGTFLNKVGVCIMCKPGKFKPYMKLFEWYSSCDDCPIGTFSNESKSTECVECETNTYANQEGSSICNPCSFGRRSSGIGSNLCLRCDTLYLGSRHCTFLRSNVLCLTHTHTTHTHR